MINEINNNGMDNCPIVASEVLCEVSFFTLLLVLGLREEVEVCGFVELRDCVVEMSWKSLPFVGAP